MSMIEFLDEYQRDFDSLYQLLESHRVLKLTYEDDVYEDPLAAYGKICEFVGIEKEGAVIRLRKTNPFPVADLIENFDAVKSHLANTSYSWMLEA